MMFYDQQEVARQRTRERIDNGLRHARHRNHYDDEIDSGARHRMAVALRRMADRLEPPAQRRTTLSFSGR